jgi:hypothetical protein
MPLYVYWYHPEEDRGIIENAEVLTEGYAPELSALILANERERVWANTWLDAKAKLGLPLSEGDQMSLLRQRENAGDTWDARS